MAAGLGEDSGKPGAVVATRAVERALERRADAEMAVVAGAGFRAYRKTEERTCGAGEEKSVEGGEHIVAAEEDRQGDMAVPEDMARDGRCKEVSLPERWDPNSQGRA